MSRKILIAAAFALVAAPSFAASLTPSQEQAVRTEISKLLRDPESARFSAIKAARQPTSKWMVCGSVNAKSAMGGYVGTAPFIGKLYEDGAFYLTKLAANEGESSNLRGLCRSYDLAIED